MCVCVCLCVFADESRDPAAVEEWDLTRCVEDVYKVRTHKGKPDSDVTVTLRALVTSGEGRRSTSLLVGECCVTFLHCVFIVLFLCLLLLSDLGGWKQSISVSPQSSRGSSARYLHSFLFHQAERLTPSVTCSQLTRAHVSKSDLKYGTDNEVCDVSHSAPCQDILLWYLSHTEASEALSALRQLSGLQGRKTEASDFYFTPGSDGGARFDSRDNCR